MFERHNSQRKGESETLLIVTDGAPNSKANVDATLRKQMELTPAGSELAITFLQIGDNKAARDWLIGLDQDMGTLRLAMS